MLQRLLNFSMRAVLIALVFPVASAAPPASAAPAGPYGNAEAVNTMQIRIVTGARDLAAGSLLELRIYEAGQPVRRLPLTHGEAWPRDSTRVLPLTLTAALDPRAVLRFSLYYRAANPLAPAWEVTSAEVDLGAARAVPQRLLGATLSGVIAHQGELSTEERASGAILCTADADCDDHRTCNGQERCAPRTAGADVRGCVKGLPVACPVNQLCTENRGCRGPGAAPASPVPAPTP